jgi:ferredoxin
MLKPIRDKGLTIIGWNDWFGSNYYTLHGVKPYPLDGHPDAYDIKEAEDWGREMAERARRIYAGEKDLVPEIPRGEKADPLFKPHGVMTFFPGADKAHRTINMEKCKYPECTLCVDLCEAKAIDFSVSPPTFNRATCLNCAFCDRLCPEAAIEIPKEEILRMRTAKRIDMTKCKYPECTICIDHCSMKAIDFSVDPPAFNHRCEGDDLCWVICPEGAIEITNWELTHRGMGKGPAGGPPPGGAGQKPPGSMVDEHEAQGRFRRYIPKAEEGKEGRIMDIERHPRFDINILMQETPAPIYYGKEDENKKE